MKLATDFLPYLNSSPDWLEHEKVKKVKSLINNCRSDEMLALLMNSVLEEIEIESEKDEPDVYLITKLTEIYRHNKAA